MRYLSLFLILASMLVMPSCSNGGGGGSSGEEPASFALGGPAAQPDGTYAYDLTVLFTNDLHDQILPLGTTDRGGMARHKTLVQWLRNEATARGKSLILVNAGDCFEGSLFYQHDGGVTLYRLMDSMGYDLVQIGNHDHRFGFTRLKSIIDQAFPMGTASMAFLGGNLNPAAMYPANTGAYGGPLPFQPMAVPQDVIDAFENSFTDFATGTVSAALLDPPSAPNHLFQQARILEIGGMKIGVFGLDTNESLYTTVAGEGELLANPDSRCEGCRFYDPAMSPFASQMIAYLEDPDANPQTDDGADVIMALTHIGLEADIQVAQNAVSPSGRRLDVIIGGHSHTKLNTTYSVLHPSGSTHIVQAGAKGEFLGRLDLAVDIATNGVTVASAELLQVDNRIPDDPAALTIINEARGGASGIDATYGNPFDTVVTTSPRELAGGSRASNPLGSLVADAVLAVGNQAPHALNLDAVVIGNFVFSGDLPEGPVTTADVHQVLPLQQSDTTGNTPDEVDVIELAGGVRNVLDLSTFPLPSPPLQMTSLEYFLEVIYGVDDILALVGSVLGVNITGADTYLSGLQWGGLEFEVDTQAPLFQKIDPSTIFVNGVPLLGNENVTWRLGMDAIIARLAMPFLQFLTQVEDPPGSGNYIPFPTYDPAVAGTGLEVWQALREHLSVSGSLTPTQVSQPVDRPRTTNPDLTIDATAVTWMPNTPVAGETVLLNIPIMNLGSTGTSTADLLVRIDTTPNDATDDPDGLTDAATGHSWPTLGTLTVGAVPGYSGTGPGTNVATVVVTWPTNLPPQGYPLHLSLSNVQSADPARPEVVTDNNQGRDLRIVISQGGT